MDNIEYVETSDAEELEISHCIQISRIQSPYNTIVLPLVPSRYLPRKRRKTSHDTVRPSDAFDGVDGALEPSSSGGFDGLITPGRSSLGPVTSTAVSHDEQQTRTEYISSKDPHCLKDVDNGDVNFDVAIGETAFGSQDELDVISQPLSPGEAGLKKHGSILSVHGLAVKQFLHLSKEHRSGKDTGSREPEPLVRLYGPLRLFSSQREAVLGEHIPYSSSMRSSKVLGAHPQRFSSLSPSSPSRTSTSIINTPLRSRPHSPELKAPTFTTSNPEHNAGPEHPLSNEETALHLADENDDNAHRRYSLRTRQARQLKPYEYDKQLYKQQMRRLPDAIVKIVSPQRYGIARVHRHREMEEDDDFIAENDDETTQNARRTARAHGSSKGSSEESETHERSLAWLPEAYHLNDDDDNLAPLSPLTTKSNRPQSASEELHASRNSRRMRVHKFPLKEARAWNAHESQRNNMEEAGKGPDGIHLAVTYKKRKDIYSRLIKENRPISHATPPPENEEPTPSPHFHEEVLQHGFGADAAFDTGVTNYDDFWDEERRTGLPDTTSTESYSNNVNSAEKLRNDDGKSESHHDGSDVGESKSPQSNSHSDADSDNGSETESYLRRLSRKQRRALGRMMPGIWIKRQVGKQSTTVKRSARSRSKSVASVAGDSSESDEVSVAPGRSRIIKRPGNIRTGHQIRGDSENSASEVLERRPSANVITVESSSDSDASEASSPDDVHDEDVLGESIADLGYFDQDFSRQPIVRREEPLIDMMLCHSRRSTTSRNRSRRHRSGANLKIGEHSLRADGLEVSISKSPRKPRSYHHHSASRQSRLPPGYPMSPTGYRSDNTRPEPTRLESPSGCARAIITSVSMAGQLGASKRLTKKQRREAAQKGTLYTLPGQRRTIGSGRRKGFLNVQIDMADDGLQRAIKPLDSDTLPLAQPSLSRTQATKVDRSPRRALHQKHTKDNKVTLKQTSLHDFAFDDANTTGTFEYSAANHRSVPTRTAADWHNESSVRTCTLDLGISVPTPGLAFSAETYLGKQLLPSLLEFASNDSSLSRPCAYDGFSLVHLYPEMPRSDFLEAVDVMCNIIFEWLIEESAESIDRENLHRHECLMRSICYFAPWIYENTDGEGRSTVQTAVSSCVNRLITILQEKGEGDDGRTLCSDHRCLSIMWYNVELSTRMLAVARRHGSEVDTVCWKGAASLLIKSLVRYGIDKALNPIEERDMSSSSPSLLAAELWVCVIHLLPRASCLNHAITDGNNPLWSIILETAKDEAKSEMSNIEISEHLWKVIFGLCAISHFSTHGIATSEPHLPVCWDIVGLALDAIRLTHDKVQDSLVSRESLKRRDRYLRMVVARCFILATKWKWPLRDANSMFKKLVDIFRSRNFGNLLGEQSEFPASLRYHKIGFLDELRASDTVFGLYLKLVMQASKTEPGGDLRSKSRMTKLLSLVVPLSGVAFSRANPPTNDELSMLVNRFSAIVIAILVDGKENANVRNRVNQARRFISFAEADDRSRNVCISVAMYMTVAVNHLSLKPEEPLKWLGDMCQILLDEYQSTTTEIPKDANGTQRVRHRLVLSIHLILSCVTNIIKKPDMAAIGSNPRYPIVDLISGPWVKRVFPLKELTNIVSTRILILQLVRSFLRAREQIIPPPRRAISSAPPQDESESQDLFEEFGLDDDVLALIPMDSETESNLRKDKEVAEIMNTEIVPNIFRLLLQYFNDPTARPKDESQLEDYWSSADEWIDCWVGCAAIVVRNEKRAWDHYLNVGPASWAGTGDHFFRRRVAVRFMRQMLKYDSTACKKDYERHFLSVFLQCLVAHRVTMENEYVSALLSVDGLRHPLLRDIPVNRDSPQEEFHVSRADFLRMRQDIISRIFSNLDSILLSSGSERDKNILVECVLEMLVAVEDNWADLSSPEDRDRYGPLCRHVFSTIRKYPTVHSLRRLSSSVAWGDASFGEPLAA